MTDNVWAFGLKIFLVDCVGLSLMEQQWVATKIMSYLEQLPGQPKPSIPVRQKALGEQITEEAHR